jgi:hypothetical protein
VRLPTDSQRGLETDDELGRHSPSSFEFSLKVDPPKSSPAFSQNALESRNLSSSRGGDLCHCA